ncbi:MAG: TIGR04255 family protein, partial [Xenococcaceae cyanobacterium]
KICPETIPAPTIRAHQHIDGFRGSYRVAYNVVNNYDCYAADIRCLAAWQSFPPSYHWGNNRGEAGRAIGNAASELYDRDFEGSIESLTKNLILQAEFGKINLQHGLVNVKEAQQDIEETCYLLNADFYTEKRIERDGSTWNLLNEFNRSARNLFRWSITDTLHNAMHPRNVEVSVT